MQETTLLFLQDGERVLLGMKKRGYGEGKWNGVGGKVQQGESIEDAMVRECQEEIGVVPLICRKVGVLAVLYSGIRVHIFTAYRWQGEPTESDEMVPYWFAQDSIPYDAMWPADKEWLPDVLKHVDGAAELTFEVSGDITPTCARIDS